jgi:hypothetical protein
MIVSPGHHRLRVNFCLRKKAALETGYLIKFGIDIIPTLKRICFDLGQTLAGFLLAPKQQGILYFL